MSVVRADHPKDREERRFEDYSHTFLHFYSDEVPNPVRRLLGLAPRAILDLGAGDGALLVAMQRSGLLEYGPTVTAVDLSEERCERLREHTPFRVICSDATSVPELEDHRFDLVLCTQVIEHVDERALLREIKRLLAPGGRAYVASVIRRWYGWWYYRTADGHWALDPTHLREYASEQAFRDVLEREDLRVEETAVTAFSLSLVEFLVRRVVAPRMGTRGVHDLFLRHPRLDWVRRRVRVRPPGYFIVESVVSSLDTER